MIYRGIRMDVSEEFPEGKSFIWWAFSSSTSSIKVLEQFLGQNGNRTIFNIECDSARDISKHSFYQSENEMLMYPARQFQVISKFNSGNKLKIIQIKEIQPPFSLIQIPQTPSTTEDQVKQIQAPFSHIQISQTSSTSKYQNIKLQQIIEQCEPKSEVDLKEQNLTDEDMEIVVKEAIIKKQCKKLQLAHNKITSVGASIISEALKNNTTLEHLDLNGNRLCDMGILALTKTFSLNSCKVYFLSLQIIGTTDEGAKYISEMLKTNKTVRYLLLGWNEITDRGVELLADVLTRQNTTLVSLRVDGHKLVSNKSVNSLVEMLKHNQTLNRLGIEKCNLSEKGIEKLRQIAQSKKDFTLIV
jgi:Ran GTPase-activating protein (RanGAP) involved in mRNA processing and transport